MIQHAASLTQPPETRRATAAALLALPTLAQAAFWVILVAFIAVLLAAVIGGAPVRMEPIVLSLFLLPARAMMSRPEEERATTRRVNQARTTKAGPEYDRVLAHVNQLAVEVYGWRRPVGLMIGDFGFGAHVVSSWRRDYLVLGHRTLNHLAKDLAVTPSPEWIRTLLLHELAHVVHRDAQRVGFAGELLWGSATILPWWIAFIGLWVGTSLNGVQAALAFDFARVPSIPPELALHLNALIAVDEATRADIAQKVAGVNFGSLITFLVLSLFPIP